MAKSKNDFNPSEFEGKEIKSVTELGNGFYRITFDDGTSVIAQFVPVTMTVVKEEKSSKKGKKEEPEDEEEEEEDEDEVSVEDMKEALLEAGEHTKKDLKKMSDEEIQEAYEALSEDEDEEEGDTDEEEEDEEEDEDGDDENEITAEDIDEADADDLEDIVEEQELDIDIEDYDLDDKKSVEKLRKAVKKALGIK